MFAFAGKPNYIGILEKIMGNSPSADQEINLSQKIQEIGSIDKSGGEEIRDFLAYVAIKIMIPIFVFAGIIIAIIGFYKLFASTSDETQKEAWDYILW